MKLQLISRMFLLLISICSPVAAQDLRLEISVPKAKLRASEPVNLTVKMINVSTKSYYVSGDISLGSFGIGHEFGRYQLQVRKRGASEFVAVGGVALDGFPPKNPSTADIIVANRLVLLEGNEHSSMFLGKTINSNWKGLTVLDPGRYSIRIAFTTYGDRTVLPKDVRYPIFLQPLVSNVLDIEITP